MQNIELNNGVWMPILGFGVYQMSDLEECERCVGQAIHAGYRSIDTASKYGNEEAVGRAIKSSGVARKDLFVTTKLWLQDGGYDKAKRAFEVSLKNLGLDYLDLYLIHQPFNDVYGSWRAMEELYKEGRIRAIGVSNFRPDRLMDLALYNEVTAAVNQIETHPFFQQVENNAFLNSLGIVHEAWSPLGMGKLSVMDNPVLQLIANKHNKSIAQVVLRWLIQRNIVVIPKSVHPARIQENINVFDFQLDAEDMEQIEAIDTGASTFRDHTDPGVVKWFKEL